MTMKGWRRTVAVGRKIAVVLAMVLSAAVALFLAGPLLIVDPPLPTATVPESGLDEYVRRAEEAAGGVIPNKSKLILWADPARRQPILGICLGRPRTSTNF